MFTNKSAHYMFVYLCLSHVDHLVMCIEGWTKNRLKENLICEYLIHNLICTRPSHSDIKSSAGFLTKQRETRPKLQWRSQLKISEEYSHTHAHKQWGESSTYLSRLPSAVCLLGLLFPWQPPKTVVGWSLTPSQQSPPDPTLNGWNATAHYDQAM